MYPRYIGSTFINSPVRWLDRLYSAPLAIQSITVRTTPKPHITNFTDVPPSFHRAAHFFFKVSLKGILYRPRSLSVDLPLDTIRSFMPETDAVALQFPSTFGSTVHWTHWP